MSKSEAKDAAALDKNRLLLIMNNPTNPKTEISIYFYAQTDLPCFRAEIDVDVIVGVLSQADHGKRQLTFELHQTKVRLMPNDRLLIICKSTMKIYDLSTHLDAPEIQSISPQWWLPHTIALQSKQYLEPVITPTCTRITFATDRAGIIGLSILHAGSQPILRTFTLVHGTSSDLLYCSGAMGHVGSIFLDWRCRVHILQYSWNESAQYSRKSFKKEFILLNSEYNMAVDKIVGLSEERGRVVLQTGRQNLAVIDLIPCSDE